MTRELAEAIVRTAQRLKLYVPFGQRVALGTALGVPVPRITPEEIRKYQSEMERLTGTK